MPLIDLTLRIEEGSVVNHPNHPRAPLIWQSQRHDVTQYMVGHYWTKENTPLFDGLPDDAGMGGKGHGWASEQVIFGTHMGTHIDAPAHFENDIAQDATTIPIEKACGSALLLDLREVCKKGKHPISMEELDAAEKEAHEAVKQGDIVLLHTGHTSRYAYGPGANADGYAQWYSGLAPNSSKWFIDRGVKLVGIDGPNVDVHDIICPAHLNFLLRKRIGKSPIYIVENLAYLENIPVRRFQFYALPLPIARGSGSPVRAVAIV